MEITRKDWEKKKAEVLESVQKAKESVIQAQMGLIGWEALLTLCNKKLEDYPDEDDEEEEISKTLKSMVS